MAAEPNDQPVPVAVAPVKLKKDAKRADRSGRDDDEPESSQEIETEIITQSLSLGELRDVWKDSSCHPGEHIVTWLPCHSVLDAPPSESKLWPALCCQRDGEECISDVNCSIPLGCL